MILEMIHKENDIKKIPMDNMPLLADEIRKFLLDKISKTGGHLGSNLGTVELTMALHLAFTLPEDKIIWDVGHQSYTHKLLTGRKNGFDELRKYGGMSGFPKRKESNCDSFDTGHSSTSISAGLGFAQARDLLGKKNHVISVIGDGSLTGGMAYEALNNAARLKTNFIVVLNDNNMSISENVGGMSKYLSNIRTAKTYTDLKTNITNVLNRLPNVGDKVVSSIKRTKSGIKQLVIPGMFFEDMGITYLGPVDGHNISHMIKVFSEAKKLNNAVLIHVITKKGKGFLPAEKEPAKYHGAEPFDLVTGRPLHKKEQPNYTDIFGHTLVKLAADNDKIVAITAAMPDGTGLKRFQKEYPDRFFDVGIAEEHAVTFAAGLAAGGLKPVVAIYSSFLQRAYDQIIHDVCIQNLPVVFAVDRAGLVGSDGETHQGLFDLSFLSGIPNMHILAPKNKWELSQMLKFAIQLNKPIAIRYPRGTAYSGFYEFHAKIELGKSEWIYEEEDIALLAVGSMVAAARQVRDNLKDRGYDCSLINARFIKPIDEKILDELVQRHKLLVTLEENVASGGYGEKVRAYVTKYYPHCRIVTISLPDDYIEHGNVDLLKKEVGLDTQSMVKRILTEYIHSNFTKEYSGRTDFNVYKQVKP